MGPLHGVKVVEMSNIGPAPFCAMLLADLGADVIRVCRPAITDLGFDVEPRFDLLNRGKQAVAVDMKSAEGVALVKQLVAGADILIEGFRPGVMERLGLGPDICHAINPRLVFGRLTGWGQQGRMTAMAGHDINYIAMMGALGAIGQKDGPPITPLNLVGDFAGGSLYLALGLLAAMVEARQSGQGQVIDAAMVDGVASLMSMHFGFRQAGMWHNARGTNTVDGGAPYYTTYETRDGKFMAVGAVEKRFYKLMIEAIGLSLEALPDQDDQSQWGALHDTIAAQFRTRTRAEWEAIFAGSDACVTPVLDMDECLTHPANVERGVFAECDGVVGPAAAPRFSRTPASVRHGVIDPMAGSHAALRAWGLSEDAIGALAAKAIIPAG